MSLNQLKLLSVVVLGFALGACGKIPKEYRGTFVDQSSGFQVELKASEGTWTRPNGTKEVFTAQAAAVEQLAKGQPGIYLRSVDDNQLEVFWVRPNLESRREEYGFIALEAEVLYTRLETKARGPVPVVLARQCDRGQVLIDRVSQSFNGGCPAESKVLELVRVAPKK